MPKFSIIIPCYNSFKFMNKSLENFENQTFNDFELVIIDDCSKDDSYEKLLEYRKNSKLDIKLFKNNTNLGPGETRNVGLKNAIGEFVLFVDADDYLETTALEKIHNVLNENNNCDCVLYDYYYKSNKNEYYKKTVSKNISGNISKRDALIYTTGTTLGKVYLLDNIRKNNIKFPNFKRNEDMPFNKIAISVCEEIYYLKEPLYFYVKNNESIMNNIKIINYENANNAFNFVESKLKQKFPYEVEAIFIVEFLYSSTMTLMERRDKTIEIKKHIEECEKRYPNLYENEVIENLPKHQKICIKLIKKKKILLLRFLQYLRNWIRKNR